MLEDQTTVGVKVPVLCVVPFVLRYVQLWRAVLWMSFGIPAPVLIPKAMGHHGVVVVAGEMRLPETDGLGVPGPDFGWHGQVSLWVYQP